MNPVFHDFQLDLDRLKKILLLAEKLPAFRACNIEDIGETGHPTAVSELHTAVQDSHAEMPILNGVLLLYLAGRFENYVRDLFEDLCDSVAGECSEFAHLPRQMRENLVKYTAEVIGNPRKYGHGENGVHAFVSTLADNLDGKPLDGVNSKCLSVTSENMWPDTLANIFGRIGVDKIFERLGEQASVQAFFQVNQSDRAVKEARSYLTRFMELRNRIAHPSGAITWPSIDQTRHHVEYCEVIGRSLAELCVVWATTLGNRENEAQPAIPAGG